MYKVDVSKAEAHSFAETSLEYAAEAVLFPLRDLSIDHAQVYSVRGENFYSSSLIQLLCKAA